MVIEVSLPTAIRRDLVVKRELCGRFGVPEHWFVDRDAERIEVARLRDGGFGTPSMLRRSDRLESPLLPGWGVSVDEILGPPEA